VTVAEELQREMDRALQRAESVDHAGAAYDRWRLQRVLSEAQAALDRGDVRAMLGAYEALRS
jgi:hypothetical protein